MGNTFRTKLVWAALLAGAATVIVGIALLLGIDSPHFSKFSADGRDTSAAIIIVLLGLAFSLYGLFGIGQSARSDKDEA